MGQPEEKFFQKKLNDILSLEKNSNIFRSVLPIVTGCNDPKKKQTGIGSACVISHKNKLYLITAYHVLSNVPHGCWVGVGIPDYTFCELDIKEFHHNKKIDLSFCTIDYPELIQYITPLAISERDLYIRNDLCCCIGFPAKYLKKNKESITYKHIFEFYSNICKKPKKMTIEGIKDEDIITFHHSINKQIRQKSKRMERGIIPSGVSGGALIWYPEEGESYGVYLLGMYIEYHGRHATSVAIKASSIAHYLDQV